MSKLQIPSVPHLVHIETTYRCNQRCKFCYNPCRDLPDDFPTLDMIVDSIYNSWVPHVYLIGGEPSLLGTARLNGYIEKLTERSSVTIVTNGQIYLRGLSNKLACIGIPVHGDEQSHDFLASKRGSYKRAIVAARRYVEDGFDVRCIPVLTKQNFNLMYAVIKMAHDIGMESVFVDRYEEGGLGSKSEVDLKPSVQEFHIALEQMIQARDELGIPVGWGTAIPYCLDPLLVKHNMTADCGAGVTFAAINPKGDVRTCNQSEIIYGNVLNEPIEQIWHKESLNEFRDLRWVTGRCRSCDVLGDCLAGCKVDVNCSNKYCVDYAMRDPEVNPCKVDKREIVEAATSIRNPRRLRHWKLNRYMRINVAHAEKYLVTRYQTIVINDMALEMLKAITQGVDSEAELIRLFGSKVMRADVRSFVSQLAFVHAIDVEGD
ncbi:MAG: radical SAM protein [Candidatus Berkelbacteria bacterium]